MAQYTFSNFASQQAAPREASKIGVYSGETKVGEISLGPLENTDGAPIYKFGLLSDIHVDTTDYNYAQYLSAYPYSDEGAGDLRRALRWFRDNEQVNLVCACGDLSQYGNDSEFEMSATEISLPSYLGFYNGTDYSDAAKYQIADGFKPSTWENNSEGRCQLQTSSSYAAGTITVLLKVKLNYTANS